MINPLDDVVSEVMLEFDWRVQQQHWRADTLGLGQILDVDRGCRCGADWDGRPSTRALVARRPAHRGPGTAARALGRRAGQPAPHRAVGAGPAAPARLRGRAPLPAREPLRLPTAAMAGPARSSL